MKLAIFALVLLVMAAILEAQQNMGDAELMMGDDPSSRTPPTPAPRTSRTTMSPEEIYEKYGPYILDKVRLLMALYRTWPRTYYRDFNRIARDYPDLFNYVYSAFQRQMKQKELQRTTGQIV